MTTLLYSPTSTSTPHIRTYALPHSLSMHPSYSLPKLQAADATIANVRNVSVLRLETTLLALLPLLQVATATMDLAVKHQAMALLLAPPTTIFEENETNALPPIVNVAMSPVPAQVIVAAMSRVTKAVEIMDPATELVKARAMFLPVLDPSVALTVALPPLIAPTMVAEVVEMRLLAKVVK